MLRKSHNQLFAYAKKLEVIARKLNKKTMKRIFHTLIIAFLFCLYGNVILAQKLFDEIEKEHPIDVRATLQSASRADSKKEWFKTKVRSENITDSVYNSELRIKVSAFNRLYQLAKSNLLPNANDTNMGVTGFLIHYGLSENNKIELFYSHNFIF